MLSSIHVPAVLEPGFVLCIWSNFRGAWSPLARSDDASRLHALAGPIALAEGVVLIVSTPSLEPDAVEAVAASLAPPVSAGFVDPAPEGILEMPGRFDQLAHAVALQAQFQPWRDDVLTFNPLLSLDEVLRYLFIDDNRDPAELPVFNG